MNTPRPTPQNKQNSHLSEVGCSNKNELRIMEFCGGHTHALVNSGTLSLLPPHIKMIHGPGCPVCVLPAHHLQALIDLLENNPQLTLACYGDVLRIPTLKGDSLLKAQSRGLKIKMLYSPLELINLSQNNPQQEYIFLAIGFETTAPATALLLHKIRYMGLRQISVLCLHVLTPPAIHAVMQSLNANERPQALIGPGHVSLVTGLDIYHELAQQYHVPIVISGFEGEDLKESIHMAEEMLAKSEVGVKNQYHRALRFEGNVHAQKLMKEVFQVRKEFTWRGLGTILNSALELRPEWDQWNAEKKYILKYREVPEHPQCRCGEILRGKKAPKDCRLFMKTCTPTTPFGACMVSSEGACHAFYLAGEAQ